MARKNYSRYQNGNSVHVLPERGPGILNSLCFSQKNSIVFPKSLKNSIGHIVSWQQGYLIIFSCLSRCLMPTPTCQTNQVKIE